MLDTLTMTQALAAMLGLYMVAAGIGLFNDRNGYAGMMDQLRDNAALGYLAGIIAFTVGAVIVLIHNVWTSPLAIAVSVVGWAALIEGVLLLAARRRFLRAIAVIPINSRTLVPFGAFTLVLGSILLFFALA